MSEVTCTECELKICGSRFDIWRHIYISMNLGICRKCAENIMIIDPDLKEWTKKLNSQTSKDKSK